MPSAPLPPKILLIDDDSRLRGMVRQVLQSRGWAVLEAPDGTAGVAQAQAHLPDLIVCDYHMEGMNGYETLSRLRGTDTTATIPFILMTGAADEAGLRQSMELGADDYLTKPFNQAEFLRCVDARVTRSRLSRRRAEQRLGALRSSIIAAVPHALKTPLNGIVGYAELLTTDLDALSREEVREMAGTIRTSALALDRLVDRFLDYTQLAVQASAPGQRTGGNPGDSAVLERAARGAAERHARSGDLRLHLSPSAPRMPGAQLGRLVDELVDNACKFSAPGSPVDLVATVRAGRFVLEVRDAGRGMTAEQIADVGALMQFDRARYEQPGAGLGLAIARLLAETNEGSLSLESAPGRGCAVIVSLPRPVGA